VIIVSWNARAFLEKCLDSLVERGERHHEVIVVDNASRDGSQEMVTAKYQDAILIRNKENVGFAKANNIGFAHSRGKYVALVNSDVIVLPGCLDALAAFLDANPKVGMVGPHVVDSNNKLQASCRKFPTIWNTFCQTFYLNRLFRKLACFSGEEMTHFAHDTICEVEILSGCFIMARTCAIEQFGFLDETFWMYGEDVDWCRRCGEVQWKVMFFPDAHAIHYGGGSSANDPVRFAKAQQCARRQLWVKHYGRMDRAMLIFLLAVHTVIRLVFAAWCWTFRRNRTESAMRIKVQLACLRDLFGMDQHAPT